ncbi:hypothetical protein BH23GEM3_BH23GEM3_13260 [soil metagenome]
MSWPVALSGPLFHSHSQSTTGENGLGAFALAGAPVPLATILGCPYISPADPAAVRLPLGCRLIA